MKLTRINKRRAIKWGIFVLLSAAYIGYGAHRCSEEGDVIVLDFKEFNPPIYDFPFSKDSIVKALHAIDDDYRTYSIRSNDEDTFRFYTHRYNSSSYIYVYRKEPKRLVQEHGELEVTLDSLAPHSTRVIVFRPHVEVGYGVKLWKSPFQFETFWYKYHRVYTPAIQEYDFLRLLGKNLGYLQNMPYTKYPKELSQQQILQRFKTINLPFTFEEIFEKPDSGLVLQD